ncbi:reverse transcriptase domain-containing protein [Tanacetum coccineum]
MTILVISVSSYSSEDSVGTPAGRVILFGIIPTTIPNTTPVITPPITQTDTIKIPIIAPTIPQSPDYTPASPDYSHASEIESDPSKDPSSDHIPPLPAISPFLSSADDTINSDTPDTPPSPTYSMPFTEITSSTQRSLVIPHHVEVDPKETSLRDDVIVKDSDEPHLEQDIDPLIQENIIECFAYVDALKDRGIDARVVVKAVDRVESGTGARGPVKVRVERVTHPVMPDDIPKPAQEGAVEVTYKTLGDLGHRIVRVESAVTALTERITKLERDNRMLRGTDSALTWWNTHKRTIGVDAAYAMNWAGLMRLMTEVYYPRNEIQKKETELWNLTVKGNDLTAYIQRFQELILFCIRMVLDEEDKVERFIGELGACIRRHTGSYYPKRYWELLPKEILGATTQKDTGSYYPKRYWELLPKEILGAITQRDTGSYYPKRYWELLPKEILRAITQRDTRSYYPKR